jgi:hypothetical protein
MTAGDAGGDVTGAGIGASGCEIAPAAPRCPVTGSAAARAAQSRNDRHDAKAGERQYVSW